MAAAALLSVAVIAACGTPIREPVSGIVQPDPSAETASERPGPTEADVRFMQGMIAHHAQALTMTGLVPTRSRSENIRLLTERIAVSQRDEIALMQRWLRDRGEEVPTPEAGHEHHMAGGDHALMPGMLTPQQLDRLAAATGAEFDRLFLEFMIRHHEGALAMVAELFASPGAGQESATFQLASEVDADQRMEIARMRQMQNAPLSRVPPR